MKFRALAATMLATTTIGLSALAQPLPGEAPTRAAVDTPRGVSAEEPVAAPAEPAPAAVPVAAPAAAAPAEAPAAAAPAPDVAGDHDAMVGRLAIGYLGYVNIPYGSMASQDANFSSSSASAPVIGMRLWFNQMLGIDAGVGITTTFGTHKTQNVDGTTTSTNATAPTGFAVHFGVPLAIKAAKHYAFEVIPEANFGYAQMSISNPASNAGTDYSGTHFDVGARAGAEIHFGFIGIPELSLVGSVGLRVDIHQTKTTARTGSTTLTNEDTRTIIGTTVNNKPWDIFLGNISALYYL
jgi:hypothetical protein